MTVYLKYGTYSGTTLSWSSSVSFNALVFTDIYETEREQGRTLRRINYNHRLSKRTNKKLVISADELIDSSKWAHIFAFYEADAWKYSTDNWTSETIVDLKEAGDMPLEFIEGNKSLKEVSLTLIQKVPT